MMLMVSFLVFSFLLGCDANGGDPAQVKYPYQSLSSRNMTVKVENFSKLNTKGAENFLEILEVNGKQVLFGVAVRQASDRPDSPLLLKLQTRSLSGDRYEFRPRGSLHLQKINGGRPKSYEWATYLSSDQPVSQEFHLLPRNVLLLENNKYIDPLKDNLMIEMELNYSNGV